MSPDLIRRANGTQATLNKFRGKPFAWEKGSHCAALLRFHLKKLGHPVPPMPAFRSAIGARRALDSLDCTDMGDVLAKLLKRPQIAPAAMLMGDVVIAESEAGLGSVFICAGPHKVFGWTEDTPRLCVWDAPFDQFEKAFRV